MRLEELVNTNYHQLNENDLYIWDYIIHHRKSCEKLSIDDLALRCNVSRSTILRFTKRLGLKGYAEFKVYLRMANQMGSRHEAVENIYQQYTQAIEQYKEYPYIDIVKKIDQANHLYVHGTGTLQESVGQYLKRAFWVTNKMFLDIHISADLNAYINIMESDDVFVAISYSGENKKLIEDIYKLKTKGVIVIALVVEKNCTLAHIADYCLYVNVLPYMSHLGRREALVSQYYVLIDFILLNYNEYIKRKEHNNVR